MVKLADWLTASRTNLYLLQRRFYKNLLFAFLAPMQTVHHWLSEKANKSHFYKDIEYGVFDFNTPP